MRILIGAMAIIVLALSGSIAYVGHQVQVLNKELAALNHRVQQEQIQLDRLQALWAFRTSPQVISHMAETMLKEDSPSLVRQTRQYTTR